MNALSKANTVALKQMLAGLSAGQRALLIRRLGEDKPETVASSGSSAAIPRARPLRVEEHPRVAVYPASPGQQRMWFLHHYAPESPVYCVPSAFRLAGPLNSAWLEAAFSAVIQRHDILRTTFAMENGELVQRVAASSAFRLQLVNLEEMPDGTRQAAVERRLDEETCRPFDLAAGLPFRAVLVRWQPAEHVLLLVLHHIISDGWSRSVFYRELAEAYAALAAGRPLPMRELPVQFADYSAWQKDWLEGGALAAQTAYWKTKLAGEPEPLDLPSDRARPVTESFRGSRCSRRLEPGLMAALQARAQEEGATLFMILLAAFKTLLRRYTGRDDLIVGVPIANRQRVEVEGLIGFFANTLAMRTTFPGDPTFRELLRRVKATAVEAYANQDLPFERLVELLQVRRDASRTPLFQATFAMKDYPAVVFQLPGIQTAPWSVTTHTSKFDFSLTLERSAEGWAAVAEYSADLFDADRVERMLEHWLVILKNIAANPAQRVSEIPLLTPAERQQILVEWNQTQWDYPRDKRLHQLFEEQVERTPEAVAVEFESQSLTYRELSARSNQLAHHLRSLGVGPDVLVAICVERSPEMIIGLLGILKSGGAYVPIDPSYPADRVAFMLGDANMSVILIQKALREKLPPTSAKVICLDSDWEVIKQESELPPKTGVTAENLAYMIYTSGSTGRPKGAMNTHQGIVNQLLWAQDEFQLTPYDTLLQKTPFSFDISVWEFFCPLLAGARLIFARPEGHQDSQYLVRLVISRQITTLHFVPSMLRHFLQEAKVEECLSLRRVICGGEALPWDLQEVFFKRLPGVALHNLYGPTEAAVFATHWTCKPNHKLRIVPIGRPIANNQIYILDEAQQPVPVGVAGELHIGGVGLARGYHNRPELTAEKFIYHPFSQVPGARLYRTGDLARYLPDGNIEFLGRIDHQVKIRGFRIELGEIESVLSAHPALSACSVLARPDNANGMGLTAFIVSKKAATLSLESLRAWLAEKLPDYMIPSRFLLVPALPLSPNGKLDRKAMEQLVGNELASGTNYVAPRNERERELAEIWQKVLRRERVGVHDNFFNLGGHSLLAVVICSQINQRFNLGVPLRQIFDHPTIAMLSATLPGEASAQDRKVFASDDARRGQVHPLSPSQFQLWFLDQLEPGSVLYNLPLLLRLKGTLNLSALKRSLTELVRRHESLRTVFVTENHQPMACILPVTEIPLEVIVISAAGPDREREGRHRAEDFVRQPFVLARGPVFRAGLICLSPDDHIVALAMHHIISDGWSLEVIQRDLAQCYGRVLHGLEPDWASLPLRFADHVDRQQNQLANGEFTRQLAYWRQQLAGVPPRLKLPADRPRPGRQAHLGATQSGLLDRSLTRDLKRLAQANDATPFLVVLSAFEMLLQRLSGQEDFVVGAPASGRLMAETQEMVGYFMTSLPLRANLAGEPTFLEVLRRCRETFLQATENDGVPLHQILAELQIERDLSQTPLFQVFINHLSYERKPPVFEGLAVDWLTPAVVDAKFDLALHFEELDGQLKLEFIYDRALFNSERVREMIRQFELLLAQVVSNPERCIPSYSLAAPAAHARPPAPELPLPAPWTGGVADRFREQADRTPGAEAVVLGENAMTYGELDHRSSQLAQYLQGLGVGPEVMVGLCLERSLEMVVALLAVLKAGGALIPIEPDLPRERIEFITADTQMPWLLTQSSLLGKLSATGARMVCLDHALPSLPVVARRVISDPWVKPENTAFTIYTSGSTGRPKGVLISQAAYLNYCGPAIDFWQLKASDRVLQFARFGFDVSIDQLLTPLLAGATVVMRAREIWDPAVFTKVIKEQRLTMVHLPPAYWQKWIETFSKDAVGKTIGNLRLIQVGGDVMPVAAVRRWRELQIPSVRLINRYGPTETTMFSTAYEVPAEPPAETNTGRIPIGRTVGPRTIHILDAQRNPVPVGVTGEIYIGGETVARGYWNRPELTAEHFIPDPFSGRPGARLYQTGDLGRRLPDGNVDFLGRADNQVKIRGYRIELGEIEAALGGHPEVSSCAVVAQEHGGLDKVLVAFVTGRTTVEISHESLRRWLAEKLPDYMIPARCVLLKTLPLNPNGKVDRKALEQLDGMALAPGTDYVAPRTEREREIAKIWQVVLRRKRIGVHDNFFSLGGHSLRAVVICSQINERFDLKLPLRWVFKYPTIEQLAKQMETLVGQSSGTVIAKAEPHRFLGEWSQTQPECPPDKCVHQLFEEQVERTPEAVAVEFESQSLTYRELNRRANRLAHQLRKLGVEPDAPVALCVERSLEMVVGLLGIIKAGGAYVPLDPLYPPERLACMIGDTVTSVLVAQAAFVNRFSGSHIEIVSLENLPSDLAEVNPNVPISTKNLAYILYTSGSTGHPKGVAMEHAPLVNLMRWQVGQTKLPLRTLQFAPLSFDVSFQEMFSTWLSGGTLVLVDPQTRSNPVALWKFVAVHKLERLFLPVIILNHLAEAAARSPQTAPELREIITAGEPLRITPAIRDLFAAQPRRTLHNHYGPTESHVVTAWTLPSDPAHWPDLPPIGRPIANTTIHLLDAQMNSVPLGAPGELYIGGAALARGYWRQPERTAEHFVPDPFAPRANGRLYRTGDLARYRPDGNLEYLGRLDQQVKIRGFRVELGEIEAALRTHASVSACAVAVQQNPAGEKSLAAFLVLRAGIEMSSGSLRAWLGAKLPDYMIPSRFVSVPALPLSSNGKLDRKSLEKLVGHELASGADCVAPRNEWERGLAEIWQVVLQRERMGVQDNFFTVGGNSLRAFLVCSQINRRLGLEMPLRWIFEHPTIEQLAKQLETIVGHFQSLEVNPTEADRPHLLPMSFAQQGMWLLQQTLPDAATYNQAVAWRLSGQVDRERVRQALKVIMERHEVLRTALVQHDGNLMQQIVAAREISLPWRNVNLQGVPHGQQQAALEEQLQVEARRPFDLAQAPLWRAVWIELALDEHVIAFTFHHSIVDEWSKRIFFDELERLYRTNGLVEPAHLPELPVQYADYAVWQRRRLTGDFLEAQRAYWKTQLKDPPPALELPTDLPRPLRPSGRGAVHSFQITGSVVTKFRELTREQNTTLFTVVLAAFQVWLHRYTGQKDVVVGTPITGRERTEVQALVGFFLNTLPIRVRLDGNDSFKKSVRQVRETLLDAFSHADLPFEQMVELAVSERQAGQQPLYQVMFVLLEAGLAPLSLDPAQSRRVPMRTGTSKSDLTLSIQAGDQAWDCQLEYATDLFTAEGAARMARHLTELLQSITEDPEQPIGRLSLMPAAERHQVVVEWNQTKREYPRDKCIHQLFEEQVERTPDAAAVVLEGNSLTYRELNARADQVAQHLRSRGVEPGALVGLRMERSFEMVIALLGILKAGGAYWALEENIPEDRLRLMLADAKPCLLLVRRESVKLSPNLPGQTSADLSTGSLATVAIEDFLASSQGEANTAVASPQAGDPAYVSYTSGSTGRPKGVVVPHRGVVRLVKGVDYVSLNAEEALLHLSPLSFDASTFELWGALLNGGRVVLLPPGPPTLADIGKAIRQHGVTTLWLTAGLFHLMVDECLDVLKPLRQLLTGGDVLSPEHVRKARRALPACRIINGYGPTENTTFTCCYTVEDERELTPSVPIGRPISNTQVYVLDSHLCPVPVGVVGELYAGGDGVACGYLHQPRLTADRFMPDPFSGQPDARLYRTGDLVRWRSDGNLEFLGRQDSQVKLRGFRIELGEVEAALRAQPEVREVTVVVREDLPGDKRLVAYLAVKTGEKPDALTLRARLTDRLPDYMIPSSFVWLDQLPLTSNGKVDRKALPAPETNIGVAPGDAGKPINLLELELICIWRRLFQREDIGRQDNFFALGGHSLLAARLSAEIDRLIGCKLPIASLFQSPTIELLARRLADDNWAPPWSSLVPLQPLGSQPPLFFVHGWGGDVYSFLELTKLLPPNQPCYGIQAVGLDGKSARHITVEEMAAHYVKEIISFQADGPFFLAGYSMGGLIAFEIARQLHRLGRRVALLALLDSPPLGSIPWPVYGRIMAPFIRDRFLFHLRRWREMPNPDRISYLRGRWVSLQRLISRNRAKPPPVTSPPKKSIQPPRVPGFEDYYHAIASAYRPRRYQGAVDVFVSDESNPVRMRSWRYLARGGVSFHRVPVGHHQILSQDYLPALAKSLTTVLHHAQDKECANPWRGG